MKLLFRNLFFAFLAIFSLFFTACSSKKKIHQKPTLDKNWRLINLPSYPDIPLKVKEITLDLSSRKTKANHYTATIECHNYSIVAYFSDKGNLQIKNIEKLDLPCDKNDDFSTEYIALLKDAKKFFLHDSYLIIQTNSGKELTFVAKEP